MKNFLIWAVVLGVVGYGGAKWYLHHKVGSGLDTAIIMMSPYVKVDYDGVSSTISGELSVDGIRARVNGFSDDIVIDRMGIDTANFLELLKLGDAAKGIASSGSNTPNYFAFIAEGIRIPANADYYEEIFNFRVAALGVEDADQAAAECVGKYGFSPRALTGLGYKEQVVSMSMELNQDASRFGVGIHVSVENMGDIDINMTMVGDMKSQVSMRTSSNPEISDFSIEYIDRSLNQRIAKYCGERGLSPEDTLVAQLDSFEYMSASNGIVFDERILDPYKEFLAGKSTFRVNAQPINPVDLTRIGLYKPSDVPALFNLSATAN